MGEIRHESGTSEEYYGFNNDGHLRITPQAALGGSSYGLEVDVLDDPTLFGADSPNFSLATDESVYSRFGFRFNPNTYDSSLGEVRLVLLAAESSYTTQFYLREIDEVACIYVEGSIIDETFFHTLYAPYGEGDNTVEMRLVRGTDGDANGEAHLYVNGALAGSVTDVENYSGITHSHYFIIKCAGTVVNGTVYIDEIQSRTDDTPIFPPVSTDEAKLLSMSLPVFGGIYFWTTLWRQTNQLYLQKRLKQSGLIVDEWSLGAATLAQVAARTYFGFVLAVTGGVVYVYGRLNDPLGAGVAHALRTTTGGGEWEAIESGFGADGIRSALISITGDLFALRKTTTGIALYRGTSSLTFVSSHVTSLVPDYGLMAMDRDGVLYVASASTDGATRLVRAAPSYTLWQDWSLSHPLVATKRLLST